MLTIPPAREARYLSCSRFFLLGRTIACLIMLAISSAGEAVYLLIIPDLLDMLAISPAGEARPWSFLLSYFMLVLTC